LEEGVRDPALSCLGARDSVTAANLAAVRKPLDEHGLLPADEFDSRLHKAPA